MHAVLYTRISQDATGERAGVSRQTLYKWREVGEEIPAGVTAAEWAAKPTPEGRAAHREG